MQYTVYQDWLFLVLVCAIIASIASIAVFWLTPRNRPRGLHGDLPGGSTIRDQIFLVDGSDLVDASTEAKAVIAVNESTFSWSQLHDALVNRFPSFPKAQSDVQSRGRLTVLAGKDNDPGEAYCEWIVGITRVHLRDRQHREDGQLQPPPVTEELETLRLAMGQAPYPVWHVTRQGNVGWCNTAYGTLRKKASGTKPGCMPTMFPSVSGKGPTGK